MEYEDNRLLDAQMKALTANDRVTQLEKELDDLRRDNQQMRRQLEDVRMHAATVERLWRKMRDEMEIK